MATRCPRAGAHSWLGDSGRRDAEDGRLRLDSLCLPAVPGSGALLCAAARHALGDRHRLWRAGGDGAARHEEAGGLLVGQPHGLRGARHHGVQHAGPAGRVVPDAGARRQHRRPVLHCRHALGPPSHASDQRVRWPQDRDAPVDGGDADSHAVVDWPSRHERVHRRIPDHARRLQVGSALRRGGRSGRDSLGGLHAVDVPAGLLRQDHQQPQCRPQGPVVPRVGDYRPAGRRRHRHGRVPQRVLETHGAGHSAPR